MRLLLKALAFAFLLTTAVPVFVQHVTAADKVCVIASKDESLERVGKQTKSIRIVPDELLTAFLQNVNAARQKTGRFPYEADEMYIGLLLNGNVGLVLFKDDCVVPGSVVASTPDEMRKFFEEFGVGQIMSMVGLGA